MNEISPPYTAQGETETTYYFDEQTFPLPLGQGAHALSDQIHPHELVMHNNKEESRIFIDTTMNTAFTAWKESVTDDKKHHHIFPCGVSATYFIPGSIAFPNGFKVYLSGKVPLLNNCVNEGGGGSKAGQWICALPPSFEGVEGTNYGPPGHIPFVAFLFWPHELEPDAEGKREAAIFDIVHQQLRKEGMTHDADHVLDYIYRRVVGEVLVGGSLGGMQQILLK